MSLLQEIETHGLADCEYNRQLVDFNYVSDKLTIDEFRTELEIINELLKGL
jgi:hypothetical protein